MLNLNNLLELPYFQELMLIYEIQYNATRDALKRFLEEQPALFLPFFTNLLWSSFVNPLLALQLNMLANLYAQAQESQAAPTESEMLAREISSHSQLLHDRSARNEFTETNVNYSKTFLRFSLQQQKNNVIICNICEKPMKNRAAYVKHRRRHLGISELTYACGTCDKRCSERRHLAIHCKNKHHEMPSLTTECEKKAGNKMMPSSSSDRDTQADGDQMN
ncbi:unnamed protein product [Thelazia callipaeda]|uniref:C2H2-type domain-containing protein n=1 Tax=Thelazia callipaeda TaxID=103827 RepID=A0A0N5CQW2_THECL|nr:unnamed protein product [Thelazia callipaeda]